jgi:alanine racemase
VRPARAEIDLGALAHNVRLVRLHTEPAELMAVVKADGYGHGAVPVARAVVDAGVTWLGVAMLDEAVVLRDHGVEESILILSEPRPDEMATAVDQRARVTVYTRVGVDAASAAAESAGVVLDVHLKVDTGMRRVGATAADALDLADVIAADPHLDLEGVWTHCAVADEPDNDFTERQVGRFDSVLADLAARGVRPQMSHAANSAAAIAHPATRYDLVRCGIALYGVPPSNALADRLDLRPVMRLVSEVTLVKPVEAGEGISYGHRYAPTESTTVATVPLGYADGVPRRLFESGGEVLIGGKRHQLAGVVTMDQLMVDIGDDEVAVGDEVVLIGGQESADGDRRDEVTANEWGDRLGTIGYEIVCGVSNRVPRVYV